MGCINRVGASSLIAAWKSGIIFFCFCKFFVYKSWFVVMVLAGLNVKA